MKKHFLIIPAVIAWAFSSSAFAGYAQLAPPSGWTAGTASAPPTYAAAANQPWLQNTVRTSASLNVGGRSVVVPVTMRMAANAPRVAAAALFLSPHLRLGLGIAAWIGVGKVVWDEAEKAWKEIGQKPDGFGYEYSVQADPTQQWFSTQSGACQRAVQMLSTGGTGGYSLSVGACEYPTVTIKKTHPAYGVSEQYMSLERRQVTTTTDCPVGWTPSGAGCLSPALTQPQFVEKLAPPAPAIPSMPSTVPSEFPHDTPWPVQQPVINPAPNPDPLANPQHQPLLVPTGDPIPNPNYNPQQAPSPANQPYIQPAVRIKPSPTPDNPWRVDVEPVQQPVPDPTGLPDPVTPETPETPKEPEAPPTDTPLGEVPDLYERKYPDGMEGVWNTYKDQLKNTSLGTLASKLMPNIPDGGTCPQWPINLDMAQWAAFGTHDVAPPCYIWGIAKAILIVSALLLARALIFGG